MDHTGGYYVMHIPPYYKKESWQRFFIGTFVGAVIAYVIFIYMYGSMYEKLYEENIDLQSQVSTLKKQNDALLEDNEDLDEKSKDPITINAIEIDITNAEELRLDSLIILQLEEMIKDEIGHIIGQDLSIVTKSDQLLLSTIENKTYTVDDFSYHFEVTKLTISQTVRITVETKLSD